MVDVSRIRDIIRSKFCHQTKHNQRDKQHYDNFSIRRNMSADCRINIRMPVERKKRGRIHQLSAHANIEMDCRICLYIMRYQGYSHICGTISVFFTNCRNDSSDM